MAPCQRGWRRTSHLKIKGLGLWPRSSGRFRSRPIRAKRARMRLPNGAVCSSVPTALRSMASTSSSRFRPWRIACRSSLALTLPSRFLRISLATGNNHSYLHWCYIISSARSIDEVRAGPVRITWSRETRQNQLAAAQRTRAVHRIADALN